MIDLARASTLYWDVFLVAFCGVALWESFQPRQRPTRPTGRRWAHHGVFALLTNVVGLLFRTSPVLVAAAVAWSPHGLLNRAWLPAAAQWAVALLALDLTRYWQHRLLHSMDALWRVHQVHHSDEDFDLTTGLRFHPVESAVTHASYLAVVAVLAPPLEAVIAVEFATMVQNFFAHANISLPDALERHLRRVVVTPEMHRVHHSVDVSEQNTNFGAILPVWDRLFGTYLAAPHGGRLELRFGLSEHTPGAEQAMADLLAMPFARRERRDHHIS
jgi:sterol desaturase/sphingolipid hydroxylase (fatty acid hydroxylase superfamily)